MALPVFDEANGLGPFDPNNILNGPYRLACGPVRTGNVVLDTPYGDTGRPEFARWLYVGTTGHVSYVKWDGTTQVLNAMTAGIWHPVFSKMINTTGTTASNLVWGS